jgi:hypothetical protein
MSERKHLPLVSCIAAVAAAVVAATALGASASQSSQGLKASLSAGKGFFVGKLQGRTLTWSLAYRRVGTGSVAARLHVGANASAMTLCSPCRNPARGQRVLSASAAQSLRSAKGYVDLRGASGSLRGQLVAGSVPTLGILSPKAGATFVLPGEVAYSVAGLTVAGGSLHLQVSVAGGVSGRVDVPLPDDSGAVTLPDVKSAFLVGTNDLAFQLATADGVALPNAEAKVIVRDVKVEGRRLP